MPKVARTNTKNIAIAGMFSGCASADCASAAAGANASAAPAAAVRMG
jgi:hypothetical protein